MKSIINDYCIRQFIGSDEIRPTMMNVNNDNGYLYATDGCMIAKIKTENCTLKYKSVKDYPNAESIFQQHESASKKTIKVEKLFNELMRVKAIFQPKMIKCGDCGGIGTTRCNHCDSDIECMECVGGEIESNEMELSSEVDCELNGINYNVKYLDLIIRTAVYTKSDEIIISNNKSNTSALFAIGDFQIILMSKLR